LRDWFYYFAKDKNELLIFGSYFWNSKWTQIDFIIYTLIFVILIITFVTYKIT
jgi:hypothetical protein